jgi:hypothetical protein
MSELRIGPRWRIGLLLLLGTLAMGRGLANGWVHDDVPLIEKKPAVHEWSGLWTGFVEPVWAPPSDGGLYRPLSRTLHTLQWMIGSGSRPVFTATNLLLYLLLILAVYQLARELLTAPQAWVAAALFAVHPVHVEVAALAVNQGETLVAMLAALSGVVWIRWRRGALGGWPSAALLVAMLVVALGFKEHALVLPLLLAGWELLLPVGTRRERATRVVALAGLLAIGAAWWMLRASILGGVAGAAPVEGLRGLGLVPRALTMLGVVGEWARLLLWPAHLQGDYSPWEIAPWGGWASEQTAGAIGLASVALGFGLAWRRNRPVAIGILWTAIALAPVSNLLIPTGILLAERTLMLPSIGAMLVLGAMIPGRLWDEGPWRVPALAGLGSLVILGTLHSASRMGVWKDRPTYVASLEVDAPESWRTMVDVGIEEMDAGNKVEGEALLLRAHATWPGSPRPLQILAIYYRLDGLCAPAVPLLYQSLRLRSDDRYSRLCLVTCLLDLGRYQEARAVAAVDTTPDRNGLALANAIRVADSAAAAGAPAHSVRLPPILGGLTQVGRPR